MSLAPPTVDSTQVTVPTDIELINTGQRYGIDPGSAKAMLFCWLDKGLPWPIVRFLAKQRLKLRAQSISSYGAL